MEATGSPRLNPANRKPCRAAARKCNWTRNRRKKFRNPVQIQSVVVRLAQGVSWLCEPLPRLIFPLATLLPSRDQRQKLGAFKYLVGDLPQAGQMWGRQRYFDHWTALLLNDEGKVRSLDHPSVVVWKVGIDVGTTIFVDSVEYQGFSLDLST